MTDSFVELQPAFVLQSRKYRETSLLLDFLTFEYGRISVLAKGVRTAKSRTVALLQPFKALLVSYSGKSELKTLTHVELNAEAFNLDGWGVYCGFYINELVSRFLHKYDPHPEVYAEYSDCLTALASAINTTSKELIETAGRVPAASPGSMALEAALRVFEVNLMQHVGFALPIEYDFNNQQPINTSARYQVQIDRGITEHPQGLVSGKTLLALTSRKFTDFQSLSEAKQLMRTVINFHLRGKPLKTREVLSKIQQQL